MTPVAAKHLTLALGLALLVAGAGGCSLTNSDSAVDCSTSQLQTGTSFLLNNTGLGDSAAQSFKLDEDSTFSKVNVRLSKTGSPTGNVLVSVQEDDSLNAPDGVAIDTSVGTLDVADITSEQAYTITLSSALTLTGGTKYWLVVKGDYANSGTDLVNWIGTTTDAYSDGQAKQLSSGGSYVSSGTVLDMTFGVDCQ